MKTYYTLLFSMIILASCSKEDASYLEDLDPDIPFYNTLKPSQTVSYELDRGGLFPDVVQTQNHITLFFPGDSAYVYHKAEASFKRNMGIAYPKFIRKTFHDNIFILKNPVVSGSGTSDELFIWNNNTGSAEKVIIPPRVLPKIWRLENGVGLYDVLEDKLVIIGSDQMQQSISFPPIVGEHKILECYFDPESGQYFRIAVLFDEALSTYYLIKENSDGMVKEALMQMTFDSTDVPSLTRFVWESDVSYPYFFMETDNSAENSNKKRDIYDLRDNQILFGESSQNYTYRLSHIHSALEDNAIYLWSDSRLDQIDTVSKTRLRSEQGLFNNFIPSQLPFFAEVDRGDLYVRDYFTGERLVLLNHDNVIGHILYNHKKKEILVADAFNDYSGAYKINIYKVPF
jgi:hypothetical protein